MNSYFPVLALLILFANQGIAQIDFSDKTSDYLSGTAKSGIPLAVADINGDGLDDIVSIDDGKNLVIYYQSISGSTFSTLRQDNFINDPWSICVADTDNDGDIEIFLGGLGKASKASFISLQNKYILTNLPDIDDLFAQGSNFIDINNDGLLDIFVCHDNGASFIWKNIGGSNFEREYTWLDMSINGSNDEPASGNYGSVWADIDNDGDQDLYIAKCRQGVTDVSDKRRINQLYINDGTGHFTEEAAIRGLAIGWQSWTADFQDINNDGFLDAFITNHDYRSQIFINDGTGYFTELDNTGLNVDGLPIQGLMRDFDNDGFVDIIVSGTIDYIYRNNGDMTFTEVTNIFNSSEMHSIALGDLNNDGFLDIYGGYGMVYNTPTTKSNKLWVNDGNDNNYISFNLQGVVSNRNAIGARIEINGPWGTQIREVRAGESYGIANSFNQNFGLGDISVVNSVIIRWPSGTVQFLDNLEANKQYQVIEGGCLAEAPVLELTGSTQLCIGDTLTILTSGQYDRYIWSTGDTTSAIQVTKAGVYFLNVIDSTNCVGFSEKIKVIDNTINSVKLNLEGTIELCEGQELIAEEIANNSEVVSYLWSDGSVGAAISITESGYYSVTVKGPCNEVMSNVIEVIITPNPDSPLTTDDEITVGETAILSADGEQVGWYAEIDDLFPIYEGSVFEVADVSHDTTFYAASRSGELGAQSQVGQVNHAGTLYSGGNNTNSGILFNALESFLLKSVKVYTDSPGMRLIEVKNGDAVLASKLVFVPNGENTIQLDMVIPEGKDLLLTTNGDLNFQELGELSPRLQRSTEMVAYPYVVDGIVEIFNSPYGGIYYYYFYDWKVKAKDETCNSDMVPVDVKVTGVATTDIDGGGIVVAPNPVCNTLYIDVPVGLAIKRIIIRDALGKALVFLDSVNTINPVDFSHLSSGIYLMTVHTDIDTFTFKIVKN